MAVILCETAFQELLNIFVEYADEDSLDLLPGHSFSKKMKSRLLISLKVNLIPLLEEYLGGNAHSTRPPPPVI